MASHTDYSASNLTWQILNHAKEHNYAVGALQPVSIPSR